MTLIQQASGTFDPSGGATFDVALPAPSSATRTVVIVVAGNTILSTPDGFSLSHSEVNTMGHYWWTGVGGGQQWTITEPGALGGGMWWVAEIDGGLDVIAGSNGGFNTAYTTPTLTPTAGPRTIIASVGNSHGSPDSIRTVTAWSNGFVEQADAGVATQDSPSGAIATLEVDADGLTGYSTTATFSDSTSSCSAIIAAFTIEDNGVLLAVDDAMHEQAADNVALTQHHVLAVDDAAHVHVADAPVLVQHHVLTVADAVHVHTADNVSLRIPDPGGPDLDLTTALILASPWRGAVDEARWNGEIT